MKRIGILALQGDFEAHGRTRPHLGLGCGARRPHQHRPVTPTKRKARSSADLLLDETARYPVLTAAQELAIATRAAAGSRKARHLLVLHSMRSASVAARRYQGVGLSHGD